MPRVAGEHLLLGVSALSARDVWAVGVRSGGEVYPGRILVVRWNGRRWLVAPTPAISNAVLNAVAAVSPRNVWAVGARGRSALAMHWNGRSWRVVPTPNVGPSAFYGVAAVAAHDVWAVGTRQAFHFISHGPRGALIEHWDGRRWSVVPDADASPAERLVLLGVAARTRNDVWAVGGSFAGSGRCIEHWDGKRWTFATIPVRGCDLQDVDVTPGGDAWAVAGDGLRLRWDGKQWTRVTGRFHGLRSGGAMLGFDAVAAISKNDVWAVGSALPFDYPHPDYQAKFRVHWNGRAWNVVASPWNPADEGSESELSSIDAVSANDVWAVGQDSPHALIERYSCAG